MVKIPIKIMHSEHLSQTAELPNWKCTWNSKTASRWPAILQNEGMRGVPLGSFGLSEITV